MVEQTIEGWLTVLEKKGLRPVADILENYGIDSETDLPVLDQDDFSKLTARGLKPLHVKKLERWCDAVCERVENMLPSSLNTPPPPAVLSSEVLNVVTPGVHSVAVTESMSENEIECDGEDDDNDSDNDMQIVGQQSCTTDSTGDSLSETETPDKKSKITLTEEQERFAKQFHPVTSKIDKTRKITFNRFRNRLKCHLLQSIILSLSLVSVNVIDYHFHLLQ
jgi:hypothetical protein